MDKIIRHILAAAVVLTVCSCQFEDEGYNPLSGGASSFGYSICSYILESAVNVMEQKVSNEEVFKDGFIEVYDEFYHSKVEVRRLEGSDSTWVVTNAVTAADKGMYYAYNFNPANLEYTLTLTLLGRGEDEMFNTWKASFTGSYDEKDDFTATLSSQGEGMRMYWKRSDSHSMVQYTLTGSGSCLVEIFKRGEPLDKTVFSYRNN